MLVFVTRWDRSSLHDIPLQRLKPHPHGAQVRQVSCVKRKRPKTLVRGSELHITIWLIVGRASVWDLTDATDIVKVG